MNVRGFAAKPGGMTITRVYVVVTLLLIALRPLLTPVPPHDFWWYVRTGQLIVEQGQIPATDSFSFTQQGAPFYNQSWLAQLLLYGLHSAGGVELIVLVQALVIAAAYGMLLTMTARRSGRTRLSVALLLLAVVPISFSNWLVRPQSYALPLFSATLLVLTAYRLRWWRRLWLLPLLMALWVNIHGSFVLALALIGITFVGEAVRRLRHVDEALEWRELRTLALWGGATALAMLLNPRGLAVLGYVRNLLGSSAVTTLVTEWAPPTVRTSTGALFFVFLIGLLVALAYSKRRPPLTDMLLMLPFLWLALGASRNIIWLGFVALPLLVEALGSLLAAPRREYAGNQRLNWAIVGLLGLFVVLVLPWFKPALALPPSVGALLSAETPVSAVEALRAMPPSERPQRLFHTEAAGSYLIWAAPEQPVFIDPRIELYPFQQWLDFIDLNGADNAEQLLAQYQFDGMLLDAERQSELLAWARGRPEWRLVFEDDRSALLVRR